MTQQLQNFTPNEVRSLRSIFKYFKEIEEDVSASVVCLAVIHALARNPKERSCFLRAIKECQASSSETSKPAFLSVIDDGRALFKREVGNNCEEELTLQQYHLFRLVHSYHRKCSAEGNYILAHEFMRHEQRLRKDLEARQIDALKCKHNDDRHQLAMAHSRQVEEYQQSWEEFLKEFERKSQAHIDELRHTHEQQLSTLKQSIEESETPTKCSKHLIAQRKRQSLMADQQRYQEAHQTKLLSDALEEKEQSDHNSVTENAIMRRELSLLHKQQTEASVLLKRIESKRKEFHKRRDDECARLVQRNKNIQASFDSKHAAECVNLASKIEQHVKKLLTMDESESSS